MPVTCDTNGHIYGYASQCVFCGTPRELPVLDVGDVVVSKFGNRWRCEAREPLANGEMAYVLRNRLEEAPDAPGTVRSGPLPEWAERVDRDGIRLWQRPTPRCQCESYEKAKGPYPSGFCPECKKWYPGITREQAIARGDIQ